MNNFTNMKIAVTAEQPLGAIVDWLESNGYREDIRNPNKITHAYVFDSGDFSLLAVDCEWGILTTLAELKEM